MILRTRALISVWALLGLVVLCQVRPTPSLAAAAERNGSRRPDAPRSAEDRRVPAAQWVAVDGTQVAIEPAVEPTWTVVCFIGNDCPLVRLYTHRLNQLQAEFGAYGVRWVAINSNRQDSVPQIHEFIRQQELTFPVIADPFHRIADVFGATRTPEIFVLDRELSIRYQGRIDDQYLPGVARQEPRRRDLAIALEQLLTGNEVEVGRTIAAGCLIGRVASTLDVETAESAEPRDAISVPTFAEHVAPVVYRHCAECHRPNDIGPFSLIDYDEVQGWGAMMVEVIDQGLMPPWHASPEHGNFANHRQMPEAEKQLIRDWVAGGAPLGDVGLLPPAPAPAPEWLLPAEPDLVVPMSSVPFEVPAEGTVDYRYFVVDPGLQEDLWVKAAQIIPGNRRVVHHSIVFIRPPDGAENQGQGWLAAYVPGQRPLPYPPGYARRIPAGSKFVFQQHYTPNGVSQGDITKLGLVVADAADITHQVDTLVALNQNFAIPPHDPNYRVTAGLRHVPRDAALLGLSPHMHYRGKAFRLTARRYEPGNGGDATGDEAVPPHLRSEIMLDIPRYDFNWQHVYAFLEPWELRDISNIEFEAFFDNSADNPANPDPTKTVTWGDQSWEEMAIVYFDVATPIAPVATDMGADAVADAARNTVDEDRAEEANAGGGQAATPGAPALIDGLTAEQWADVEQRVEEFFQRFGQTGRETIPQAALPEAVRRFAGLDRNGDQEISRQELREAFRHRAMRQRR